MIVGMDFLYRMVAKRPFSLALSIFTLLALIFLSPALFPADGELLGGHDMRGYYHPLYAFARDSVLNGRLPLWNKALFNGYPIIADPQMAFFYPVTQLAIWLPSNVGVSWYMVAHIILSGMGMFWFVWRNKGTWTGALLAGLTYAFSGFFAGRLWAGHGLVYAVFTWLPWVLGGLNWSTSGRQRGTEKARSDTEKGRGFWRATVVGVFFGLAVLAGHMPSLLYFFIIWLGYAVYLASQKDIPFWHPFLHSIIIGVVGLALASVQLFPFVEFSLASSRVANADFQFATDYSLPPVHLITLLIPEFFGEPSRAGYWSVQTFEELAYYAGVVPILAIVLAFWRPRKKMTWFYLALMAIGLLLALGRYGFLYKLAFNMLPPFRFVRAPGRAAILYTFAAAGLLGHVVSDWSRHADGVQAGKVLKSAVSLLALICTAGLAATGAVFMSVHPTDTSGRLWHQAGGWATALAITALGGGLLWAYLKSAPEKKERRAVLGILLACIVVTDLWLFGFKFVRLETSLTDNIWPDAQVILGETEDRVMPWGLNIFAQNGATQFGLNSVFGYLALEPDAHLSFASSVSDPRSSAYDVLATKFVISHGGLDQFTEGENGLELVAQNGAAWIYLRPNYLEQVRLVHEVEVIEDGAAAIQRVHQPEFDAGKTAVLSAPIDCDLSPATASSATVLDQRDGYWQISTASDVPSLLVVAESAYPGWEVTVDGQSADSHIAYTTLKAVCVPAGEHLVEWQFKPKAHVRGGIVSLIALGLCILAILVFRKNEKA